MIQTAARLLEPILESGLIRRTRRNHALEHATVHMLARKVRNLRIAGRSSDGGFVLIGNVSLEEVEEATAEALKRLQNGEEKWAIHPNCGTNLATAGALTTAAGVVGLRGEDGKIQPENISRTMVLMILAMIVARPIGMRLQKHITTKGDPGDLDVINVTRREFKLPFMTEPIIFHRIHTRRG